MLFARAFHAAASTAAVLHAAASLHASATQHPGLGPVEHEVRVFSHVVVAVYTASVSRSERKTRFPWGIRSGWTRRDRRDLWNVATRTTASYTGLLHSVHRIAQDALCMIINYLKGSPPATHLTRSSHLNRIQHSHSHVISRIRP